MAFKDTIKAFASSFFARQFSGLVLVISVAVAFVIGLIL